MNKSFRIALIILNLTLITFLLFVSFRWGSKELLLKLDASSHEQGYAYLARLKAFSSRIFIAGIPVKVTYKITKGDSFGNSNNQSALKIFENGRPLEHPHSLHADIRTIGKGRYSHWGENLYFSSSDNSNPNNNGRTYTIQGTWVLSRPFKLILSLALLLLGFIAYCLIPGSITQSLFTRFSLALTWFKKGKNLYFFSGFIVIIAFAIGRYAWWVDFRIPILTYDTSSYFNILRFWTEWAPTNPVAWYNFMRTPGYPIFLRLAFAIYPGLKSVIILQTALTLTSMLFFLHAIYKTCGNLIITVSIAMISHAVQPLIASHDFALMTESLFTSLFLFSLGFLLLGTQTRQFLFVVLSSLLAGFAIGVRPSGIFLLITNLLGVFYLFKNSAPKKLILGLLIPAPLVLVLIMSYHFLFFQKFALSSVGDLCHFGSTALFWETNPSFPKGINDSIQAFQSRIPYEDRKTIFDSWDPGQLLPIFSKWGAFAVYHAPEVKEILSPNNPKNMGDYQKTIAQTAIHKYPKVALKFFWANLYVFLDDQSSYKTDLYDQMKTVIKQMYVEGTAKDPFIGREFSKLPEWHTFKIITTPVGSEIQYDERYMRGRVMNSLIMRWSNFIFDNNYWTVFYLCILGLGVFIFFLRQGRDWNSFALLAISSNHLLAGIALAFSTTMVNRYPSPTRFIELCTLGLMPLLWRNPIININNHGKNALPLPIPPKLAEEGMSQNVSAMALTLQNYYRWNLSLFPIEKQKRILDVGCGPCLYLESLMEYRPALYFGIDSSNVFLTMAQKRLMNFPNCTVKQLNINASTSLHVLSNMPFDYVLCFDLIEHLEDDSQALRNIRHIMNNTPQSLLFIRVPALPFLYGKNDMSIGHYRRYTAQSLRQLLYKSGFKIDALQHQNLLGIFPWFINGKILRRSIAVNKFEGSAFDSMVPLLRKMEAIFVPPIGLSLCCVATPAKLPGEPT